MRDQVQFPAALDPLLILYFLAAAWSIAVRNARVYCRFFSRTASKRSIADAVLVLILCSISVRMHWQWTSWCILVRMRRCHALAKSSVAPSHAHLSSKFDAMNDERINSTCTSGMHRHGCRGALRTWRAFSCRLMSKAVHASPPLPCSRSRGIPCGSTRAGAANLPCRHIQNLPGHG